MDYFKLVVEVLSSETLAPYIFVIAIDYITCMAIGDGERLGFSLSKGRSQRVGPVVKADLDLTDALLLLTQ